MIVVITGGRPGQRYELTDAAEIIVAMVVKHAATINAVTEGKAEWLLWPDGGVEFNLTQMVDDNMRTPTPVPTPN